MSVRRLAAGLLGMASLLCTTACGRIGFDTELGPFTAPVAVDELNTSAIESDPALTSDLLEMYFDSDRPGVGSSDIWRTTRPATDAPWSTPTLVNELSSPSFDGGPGITPDGLVMYLTSARPGGKGLFDLWLSSRSSRDAAWSAPVFVAELSSPDDDSNAQPEQDGRTIWFASARNASARRLYRATRPDPAAAWSTPELVEELDAGPSTTTADPAIRADRLELFHSSNREGTMGGNDIWHATRASATDPFDETHPVVELSSPQGDIDPWISGDGRFIMFTSRRTGNEDLYWAER